MRVSLRAAALCLWLVVLALTAGRVFLAGHDNLFHFSDTPAAAAMIGTR